jgi:hypothetical protein
MGDCCFNPDRLDCGFHLHRPGGGKAALVTEPCNIGFLCPENVYCNVSGVVTEAHWDGWTESDLHPFIDVVLECFGSKRLVFGSDRPVSLVTWPYKKWTEVVARATKSLSGSERDRTRGAPPNRLTGFRRPRIENIEAHATPHGSIETL